jgi:hypothetical protein
MMLAVALMILASVSAPASVGIDSVVANYLRPVIEYAGGGARVDYEGICPGHGKLLSPTVNAQPAPQGSAGTAAVRQIFRGDPNVTVMQDQSGMLRITVGTVSKAALQTSLGTLTLNSGEQYTPPSAVLSIAIKADMYAKKHRLPFGLATTVIDILVGGPVAGAPHLPPVMQNVTADEALDFVAGTFKGIVLYGSCKQSDGKGLFKLNYIYGS